MTIATDAGDLRGASWKQATKLGLDAELHWKTENQIEGKEAPEKNMQMKPMNDLIISLRLFSSF